MTNWRIHLGEAATRALSALVTESFAVAGTRRLADVEVPPLLTGPADTSEADALLAPSFDSVRVRRRDVSVVESPGPDRPDCTDLLYLLDSKECIAVHHEYLDEVTITVQLRSLRTARTFTWELVGRSAWEEGVGGTYMYIPSDRRSGSALEHALRVLTDYMAAYRLELEQVSPHP